MVRTIFKAKTAQVNRAATPASSSAASAYGRDLDHWPHSWMGLEKRPATRRSPGGLLPALHRASGRLESFPENDSPARGQSLAAGWRNHPRAELHPCSEKGRCPETSS